MAASMWRMNGLWRRTAGVLVLCALLLSNNVICQDDADDSPATDPTAADASDPAAADPTDSAAPADPAGTAAAAAPPDASVPPAAGDATDAAGSADSSAAPDGPATTILSILPGGTSGTSGTPASPLLRINEAPAVAVVPEVSHEAKKVVPNVQCVGKEDVPESNAVKAVVDTADCEATKRIIQQNPAGWCSTENCNLDIFQDGNQVLVASKDAGLGALAAALQSEDLKGKLGVTKTETPSSSGSAVLAGILVSGLLLAAGITVGYCKCLRKTDPKGVKLAEDACPVDPENQGNTLVSVAPLNPPPETQEKPSVNGESPEAAKTQPPPPTNGHSTAKTADTEL